MHAIRVASAALLGATALSLSLTIPFGYAASDEKPDKTGDPFQASVSPATIAAGGRVTLHASGCDGDTVVSSGVFDPVTIRRSSQSETATVDGDAKQGAAYSVSFRCAGNATRTNELTIASGSSDNSNSDNDHGRQENGDGGRQDSGRDDNGRQDSGRDDSGRQDSGREDNGRDDNGRQDGEHDYDSNVSNHGVKAGIGGSLGGFDLQEIGLGAALIAGSLGTAVYWSRRRTGDETP